MAASHARFSGSSSPKRARSGGGGTGGAERGILHRRNIIPANLKQCLSTERDVHVTVE
jgi:hypothetical protein